MLPPKSTGKVMKGRASSCEIPRPRKRKIWPSKHIQFDKQIRAARSVADTVAAMTERNHSFEPSKVKGAGGGSVASIHVGPDDKQIVMRGSETILAASLREGIPHAYACGGRARCSICRISVEEGLEFCSPRSKGEQIVAERLNFSPKTRLACQTKITGHVNVRRLVVDDDDVEFTRGIAQGPRPASIGEEKKLAILFADVRGFTALSERMSPYDVIYFLNRYFHLTSQVIESYGGYVDNYMGDG